MKAYQWIAATLLAGATLVGAPSGEAWAQDPAAAKKVEQLSTQARERYGAGDFAGAIALFEQAYALEPVPNLLYNIAKCYEKMQDWKKAIEYYEKFVVSPDVASDVRQSAMTRSKELREIVAAEDKLKEPKDPKDPKDGKEVGDKTPPPPAEPDRTVSYVVMGVGGALVLGGGVMGLLASGEQSAFEDATTAADKRAARDSGENLALGADVLYGVGAAALITGVILFITAEPEAPAEGASVGQAMPVNVWFGQGAAGVDMTWRF